MVPTKHGTIRISSLAFIPYIVVVALRISQKVHRRQLELNDRFFRVNICAALVYPLNGENGIIVLLDLIIIKLEHTRSVSKHLSHY